MLEVLNEHNKEFINCSKQKTGYTEKINFKSQSHTYDIGSYAPLNFLVEHNILVASLTWS